MTLQSSGPRPRSDAFPAPIAQEVHRCPHCRTPAFLGTLGTGTAIEVQCRRKACKGNVHPFRIYKM